MYDETKHALKKAFNVSKILFSLGGEQYSELLRAVSLVSPPTIDELSAQNEEDIEDLIIYEMKERYKQAAVKAGFEEKHGLAMLEYAILCQEIKDGQEQ